MSGMIGLLYSGIDIGMVVGTVVEGDELDILDTGFMFGREAKGGMCPGIPYDETGVNGSDMG
jgi:hypothetical protein